MLRSSAIPTRTQPSSETKQSIQRPGIEEQNHYQLLMFLLEGLSAPSTSTQKHPNILQILELNKPQFFKTNRNVNTATQLYEVAELLAKTGYTREQLSDFHRDAIIYLVSGVPSPQAEPQPPKLPSRLKLSPEQVVSEIKNLNIPQVALLQECYILGLRGNHLREWTAGQEQEFRDYHQAALENLIKNNTPPQKAVQKTCGMSENEAWTTVREIQRKSHPIRP